VSASPYEGQTLIADKSAWERAKHPAVRDEWAEALLGGQIATCPIVKFEILFSAIDGPSYDQLNEQLGALRDVPITRSVTNAALAAMRQLAHRNPPLHRSPKIPDTLIAAAAQDVAVGVLHYDHHFDLLAEVLSFESRWIAPAGSI
jgi:predicted nucleic acid-binding protein